MNSSTPTTESGSFFVSSFYNKMGRNNLRDNLKIVFGLSLDTLVDCQ